MKKDILYTLLTQFVVLLSLLIGYRLSLYFFGQEGFSTYSLVKRDIGFIAVALSLGMSTSITRYLAFNLNNNKKQFDIFVASITIFIVVLLLIFILIVLFKTQITYLFFSNLKFSNLVYPIFVSSIGIICHTIAYSFYRGILKIRVSNLIEIVNIAFFSIFPFVFSSNIVQVLYFSGYLQIIFSILIFIKIYKNIYDKSYAFFPNAMIKKLLSYGLQRLPADIGFNLLLLLPVLIATHNVSYEYGATIAFAITWFSIIGYLFSPFNAIILPRMSVYISNNQIKMAKNITVKLLMFVIISTICIYILELLLGDFVLKLYLGEGYTSDIKFVINYIMYAIIGYTIYLVMRGVVDALFTFGVNSFNIGLSIIFYVFLVYLLTIYSHEHIFLSAFVATMYFLSVLTMFWVFKGLKKYD